MVISWYIDIKIEENDIDEKDNLQARFTQRKLDIYW